MCESSGNCVEPSGTTLILDFDLQKHDGYPSGSMVDFALDADGAPILAVSSLAVHSKVSLCTFISLLHFI